MSECKACGHSVVAWCPHDSRTEDDLICYNCGLNENSAAAERIAQLQQENEALKAERGWVSVKDRMPNKREPVVYAKPKSKGGKAYWGVGIAYWTVSEKWNPEAESQRAPDGFTHWTPLLEPPNA